MLRADRFFDTNILLYLMSDDATKADRAEELIGQGGIISVQVLNEFTAVSRRKLKMEWSEIHEILKTLRSVLSVTPLTVEIHDMALRIAQSTGYQIYDSLILAAASDAAVPLLITEDLHDGQVVSGVRIVNPFNVAGPL